MNDLNLKELLIGDLNRLRYVQRYSTSMVMHRENVAEHSYYVGLYAYYLVRWVYTNTDEAPRTVDILTRAMFHDVDEARTGDFQRPFKYSNPELKEMMDRAAQHEAGIVISAPLPDDSMFLQDALNSWRCAKDKSIEGCIIALADFMAVVSYLWQEAAYACPTLHLNYTTLLAYIHTFDDVSYEPLRPIIRELAEIVNTVANQAIGAKVG